MNFHDHRDCCKNVFLQKMLRTNALKMFKINYIIMGKLWYSSNVSLLITVCDGSLIIACHVTSISGVTEKRLTYNADPCSGGKNYKFIKNVSMAK